MAKRLYFIPRASYRGLLVEKTIHYPEVRGERKDTLKKSLETMHHRILAKESGGRLLEVSPYGSNLGKKLTPWTLTLNLKSGESFPVAAILESAKVFERGGPYEDLAEKDQDVLLSDTRLTESGRLLGYHFEGEAFTLNPRHKFFDYLYIRALSQKPELFEDLLQVDILTDITYQMHSMYLSPARAVGYFISLLRLGILEEILQSDEKFNMLYTMSIQAEEK